MGNKETKVASPKLASLSLSYPFSHSFTLLAEQHISEPSEGSARASKWSRLRLMTPFVFCCCAASADLGMRDTGWQQLYLVNRPPLASASLHSFARRMTKRPFIPFLK